MRCKWILERGSIEIIEGVNEFWTNDLDTYKVGNVSNRSMMMKLFRFNIRDIIYIDYKIIWIRNCSIFLQFFGNLEKHLYFSEFLWKGWNDSIEMIKLKNKTNIFFSISILVTNYIIQSRFVHFILSTIFVFRPRTNKNDWFD